MILESVSQDRDIVCQEALNARDIFQKSERAAQLPRTEVQNLTHHSSRKLEKPVRTLTICMKESLRKTTNLLLKEIEHQSKNQRFFSRTLRLKNGETSSDPTKKRWTLSEHFPRLFCPTKKKLADRCHHAVMRPCQLQGKKLRVFLCVLTQTKTLCLMRVALLCQRMNDLRRISPSIRNRHRRTFRMLDPWMVIPSRVKRNGQTRF